MGSKSDGDEREHSVVDSKLVDLLDPANRFVPGTKVFYKLLEGNFPATIITTGMLCIYLYACIYVFAVT